MCVADTHNMVYILGVFIILLLYFCYCVGGPESVVVSLEWKYWQTDGYTLENQN